MYMVLGGVDFMMLFMGKVDVGDLICGIEIVVIDMGFFLWCGVG